MKTSLPVLLVLAEVQEIHLVACASPIQPAPWYMPVHRACRRMNMHSTGVNIDIR